uniref:Putative ovule protein n=1 Tax=Solanum chacoense TaxID=4108 RepID=A0A0V0I7V4_SOLCH
MGAGEGEVWTEALMANEKNGDSVNFTCRKKADDFLCIALLVFVGLLVEILGSFLVVGSTFLVFLYELSRVESSLILSNLTKFVMV